MNSSKFFINHTISNSRYQTKKRWCISIKFKILVFYKDEKALHNYLDRFHYLFDVESAAIRKSHNEIIFENDSIYCRCIKGLNDGIRPARSHVIAVQEELTWRNWDEIKTCLLHPMLLSPIDIQVFDGIDMDDVICREGEL